MPSLTDTRHRFEMRFCWPLKYVIPFTLFVSMESFWKYEIYKCDKWKQQKDMLSHFKVRINAAVKWLFNPTKFYLFKVTNKNSRKTCEIWRYQSKVTNRNSRKTCEIWRYQSKVIKKDTRTTLITFWFLYYQLRIYFTYFPRVSLVHFQQVNVCRKTASVLNIVPRISSNVFKFLRTFH